MKCLVNMKNKDYECFQWCHIRYLNPHKKDLLLIKKVDKKFTLNYSQPRSQGFSRPSHLQGKSPGNEVALFSHIILLLILAKQ